MRVSARIIAVMLFSLLAFSFFKTPAFAQTTAPSNTITVQTTNQPSTNTNNFLTPNVDSNVPQNHHEYTQVVLIDVLSAITCQITGIDPTNPQQPCLGVDPTTGKIGMQPAAAASQFGQAQNTQPQIGGALGMMTGYISSLYIPAVSTSQYTQYLADNFGIVKKTYAAGLTNCSTATLGFGFCGLSPIFALWTGVRDMAYAILTVLFIAIGIGVMLRFRVDPRTVMTLQNQIPRVIIAIILITFSYAIAGAMIDLMWTVTYAGINFISQNSTSKITLCPESKQLTISQGVEQRLIDQPLTFTNTMFRYDPGCTNNTNGLFTLSEKVSGSVGDLVTQVVTDLLNLHSDCAIGLNIFHDIGCVATNAFGKALLWLAEQAVNIIILVILLIALFRLWFQLIKTYLTFIIFVILGPIWIVLGLIPGRPMGFEKWLRIIFTNLAIFPLVAFILVFARVIVDAVPKVNPQTVFVPPLVGNPNISTFSALMGFGAILIAPSIPDLIRERMKAKGQSNYGAIAAAGIGAGVAAATSPGKRMWEGLNRKNPTTQEPEGPLAVMKQRALQKTPFFGRRAIAKKHVLRQSQASGDYSNMPAKIRAQMSKLASPAAERERQQVRADNPSLLTRAKQNISGRRQQTGRQGGAGGQSAPGAPGGASATPPRATMHPSGGAATGGPSTARQASPGPIPQPQNPTPGGSGPGAPRGEGPEERATQTGLPRATTDPSTGGQPPKYNWLGFQKRVSPPPRGGNIRKFSSNIKKRFARKTQGPGSGQSGDNPKGEKES